MRILLLLALTQSASAFELHPMKALKNAKDKIPGLGFKNPPELEQRLSCFAAIGELVPGEFSAATGLAHHQMSEFSVVRDPRPGQDPNSITFYVVAGEEGEVDSSPGAPGGVSVTRSKAHHRIWRITLNSQDRAALDKETPVSTHKTAQWQIDRGEAANPEHRFEGKAALLISRYRSDRVWIPRNRHSSATFDFGWTKQELSPEAQAKLKAQRLPVPKPRYRRDLMVDASGPPAERGVAPLDPANDRDLAVIQDAVTNVLIPNALARLPYVYTNVVRGDTAMPERELKERLMSCVKVPALDAAASVELSKIKGAHQDDALTDEMLDSRRHR